MPSFAILAAAVDCTTETGIINLIVAHEELVINTTMNRLNLIVHLALAPINPILNLTAVIAQLAPNLIKSSIHVVISSLVLPCEVHQTQSPHW